MINGIIKLLIYWKLGINFPDEMSKWWLEYYNVWFFQGVRFYEMHFYVNKYESQEAHFWYTSLSWHVDLYPDDEGSHEQNWQLGLTMTR